MTAIGVCVCMVAYLSNRPSDLLSHYVSYLFNNSDRSSWSIFVSRQQLTMLVVLAILLSRLKISSILRSPVTVAVQLLPHSTSPPRSINGSRNRNARKSNSLIMSILPAVPMKPFWLLGHTMARRKPPVETNQHWNNNGKPPLKRWRCLVTTKTQWII